MVAGDLEDARHAPLGESAHEADQQLALELGQAFVGRPLQEPESEIVRLCVMREFAASSFPGRGSTSV